VREKGRRWARLTATVFCAEGRNISCAMSIVNATGWQPRTTVGHKICGTPATRRRPFFFAAHG